MRGCALLVCLGLWSCAPGRTVVQAPVLPPPGYESALQIGTFCLKDCTSTADLMKRRADVLRSRVGEGPYLKLGISAFSSVGMDWPLPSDPSTATLAPDVERGLRDLLENARQARIGLHVSALFGVTRATNLYAAAVAEDRRNSQWLATGAQSWLTPSRYARRLRAHLEAKVRAFTRLLVRLRAEYPETLLTVAADGEVELSIDGLDEKKPLEGQLLADYSPFAVAEFRDWVRGTGLYAPGAPFAGQGRAASGTRYRSGDDARDLAAFNADFSVAFGSWELAFFDWSLDDPVDADPNALGPQETRAPGFSPVPRTGPRWLAGGFDAPRSWNAGSPAFWRLWLSFREAMVASYVRDVSGWIAGTTGPDGSRLPRDRVFTYQIPADYYLGTHPGCLEPEPRLLTSASTLDSADTGGAVSLGITVFDTFHWDGRQNSYRSTSEHLFRELAARRPAGWGIVESNLSWPISAVEVDRAVVAARIRRGWAAGMHLYGYHPWPLDPEDRDSVTLDALGDFARSVWNEPFDAALRSYAPPVVGGLTATAGAGELRLEWDGCPFADHPELSWTAWPDFLRFELLRARAPDAPAPAWKVVWTGTSARATLTGDALSADARWYRVRAVSRKALRGEPGTPVVVPSPLPAGVALLPVEGTGLRAPGTGR